MKTNSQIHTCMKFFMIGILLLTHQIDAQIVTTVAGTGVSGFSGDGGPATSAMIKQPYDVALDNDGNLLITDRLDHRIRKVNMTTGIISTIAGTGIAGFTGDGGTPTAARLQGPLSVLCDNNGDIYISDSFSGRLRKISGSTNVITTIAGITSGCSYNGDNIPAVNARFCGIDKCTFDLNHNILIPGGAGGRVRRINLTNGLVNNVAGDPNAQELGDGGPATLAQIIQSPSIAIDRAGNIYLAQQYEHRIRKISASTGIITTIVGNGVAGFSGDGGPSENAQLHYPMDIAIDQGDNLFIAEYNNGCIRRVDAITGIITTVVGHPDNTNTGNNISAAEVLLANPVGIFLDDNDNLYIAEANGRRVRKVSNINQLPTNISPNGLVAWYPFNGNTNDESGNNINGNVFGAIPGNDRFGNPNQAYCFDGNDYIIASADLLPTMERTISLWFSTTTVANSPCLLSYGGGGNPFCGSSYLMNINNQDVVPNTFEVQAHCTVNRLQSPYLNPPLNEWKHWVITTSSIGTKMYIDGVEIASNNFFMNNTNTFDKDLVIGNILGTNGLFAGWDDPWLNGFIGCLDDIAIWNRALNATEISNLYTSSLASTVAIEFESAAIPCSGDEVIVHATIANAGTNPTIHFLVNDVEVQSGPSLTFSSNVFSDGDEIRCILETNIPGDPQGGINSNSLILELIEFPSNLEIQTSDNILCTGEQATLFNINPDNNYTYAWSLNGSLLPDQHSQSLTVQANGIYVLIRNFESCSDESNPLNITFANPPQVDIVASDTEICQGSTTILSVNDAPNFSFVWYKDGIQITNLNYHEITIGDQGSYNVVVFDEICLANSNVVFIEVHTNPTVSYTGLASSYLLSSGSSNLIGNPVGGVFSGPGVLANTFNPQLAGIGQHSITYTYTNSFGCSGTQSHQTSVIGCVFPPIPSTISVLGGPVKVCPGDTRTYKVNQVGIYTYSWTLPVGATVISGQGTNQILIQFNLGFTQNSSISVAANNGCGFGPSRTLNIIRNVPTNPSAIGGEAYGVCEMQGVPYFVTNVAGLNYSWSFTNGNASIIAGQGTSGIQMNFSSEFASGILSVQSSNACGTSLPKTLAIRAVPKTPGPISGDNVVCPNEVGVAYSVVPVDHVEYYIWSSPPGSTLSDGALTSSSNILTTVSNSVSVNFGTVVGYVKCTAGNACGNGLTRSYAIAINCSAGFQMQSESAFSQMEDLVYKIHPNPMRESVFITGKFENSESVHIRILDVQGNCQFTESFAIQSETQTIKIEHPSLPTGLYLIEISSGGMSERHRIIKTN